MIPEPEKPTRGQLAWYWGLLAFGGVVAVYLAAYRDSKNDIGGFGAAMAFGTFAAFWLLERPETEEDMRRRLGGVFLALPLVAGVMAGFVVLGSDLLKLVVDDPMGSFGRALPAVLIVLGMGVLGVWIEQKGRK